MKLKWCALLVLLSCVRKPARPVLTVFEDPNERGGAAAQLDPNALALALGAMRSEARSELRERLTAVTDDELKRTNPLIVDLDDTDTPPRGQLAASLRGAIPSATAALNLLGGPWSGPGLRVELSDSCPKKATRCMPLFDPSLDRKAAFLAWAWSNAVMVKADEAAVAKLREAAEQPGSTIALVLTQSRGELDGVEVAALKHQAERALPHLEPDSAAHRWLDALAHLPREFSIPLHFSAGEALAVPRLSALAKLDQFDAELKKCGCVPEK